MLESRRRIRVISRAGMVRIGERKDHRGLGPNPRPHSPLLLPAKNAFGFSRRGPKAIMDTRQAAVYRSFAPKIQRRFTLPTAKSSTASSQNRAENLCLSIYAMRSTGLMKKYSAMVKGLHPLPHNSRQKSPEHDLPPEHLGPARNLLQAHRTRASKQGRPASASNESRQRDKFAVLPLPRHLPDPSVEGKYALIPNSRTV